MRYAVEAGNRDAAGKYRAAWFREDLGGAGAFAVFNELRQDYTDVAIMTTPDNLTVALYDARGIERAA